MIEIAKIIDSQIESRLSKFKKDMKSYVDNHRVGAEQIEPGAIIPPKLSEVPVSKIPQLNSRIEELTGDMREAIETAEGDIADARSRLATAEGALTDAEGNISALQTTASSLTSDIANATGDISTLQQTAQGLEAAVSDAEGAISALELTAQGLTTAVGNAEGDISTLQQKADEFTTRIANAEDDISAVEQTAGKINWLVKSGDSASNMTLTDKTFDLVAENINLNGKVTFSGLDTSTQSQVTNGNNANTTVNTWRTPGQTTINGGMIETHSVKAAQVDVEDLFADAATINALKTKTVAAVEAGGGAIQLSSEGLMLSGGIVSVNVSGTNGDMSLDENGMSIPEIDSPSVAARYTGPSTIYVNKNASDAAVAAGTHFRSLKAALNSLRYKHLGYQVTVSIANGTYYESDLRLWGVCGGHMLTIEFNDATLADTYFELANCTTSVILDKMRLTQRSIADHGVYVAGCKYVRLQQCRLTALTGATSTTAAIQGDRGSKIDVRESHMYGGWRAFRCNGLADGISINNKGNCRLAVDGSVIIASGTQPCDQSTFAYGSANGGIIHQTGVTVDFGSATPPEPATVTQTFAATTTRTAHGSAEWPGSWRSETNAMWQGYTSGMQYQVGMMWFGGIGALAGKTIRDAKLTLRRVSGIGPGGKVKIIGYYGARASNAGSGSPTGRTSMGTLGTLSNGQQDDFTIPAAAISYLAADPTGRCIALHPGNSSVASGHDYSWDYCKFYGVGSGYVPYLEVTYEN